MLAGSDIASSDLFDGGGARLSDYQAERELLGLILNKADAMADVAPLLQGGDFFDPFHRRIFEGLEQAFSRGDLINASTLLKALGNEPDLILFDGMTAGRYVAQLLAQAELSADPIDLAEHIAECAERRAVGAAEDTYAPFRSKFGGMSWGEIGTSGAPLYEWVIEDIIPKGEPILIFGDSGTGKSFQAFDMGVCVARGIKFRDKNVEPGLVIYVAAEAGKGFAKRKLAYCIHHGLSGQDIPFYLMTRRPDFFSSDTDVEALIAEIKTIATMYNVPLVMIVLDTLSALAPGMNENASADVSKVRQRIQKVVDSFGASVIVIHHKPKGGSTPRGHGSLTGDFETNIEFATTDMKTIDGLCIHHASAFKQREGKKGLCWDFALPVVTVGRNKWGNDETSCVVVPYDPVKGVFAYGFKPNKTELAFLEALFDALNEHPVPPPPGLPSVITKAVDLADVRDKMRARYITGEDDVTKADNRFRAAFKRAGDSLKAGSVIGYRTPLVWYTGKKIHGLEASVMGG